jgi:hypothetical protein
MKKKHRKQELPYHSIKGKDDYAIVSLGRRYPIYWNVHPKLVPFVGSFHDYLSRTERFNYSIDDAPNRVQECIEKVDRIGAKNKDIHLIGNVVPNYRIADYV